MADVRIERRCPHCFSDTHGPTSVLVPGMRAPSVSVSHSDHLVLVAVCDSASVGVDVEALGRVGPVQASRAGSGATNDDAAAGWVQAEAVLKAVRAGLAYPLERLWIGPDGWWPTPDVPDVPLPVRPHRGVGVRPVAIDDGYCAAVAVVDAVPRVRLDEAVDLIGVRPG